MRLLLMVTLAGAAAGADLPDAVTIDDADAHHVGVGVRHCASLAFT